MVEQLLCWPACGQDTESILLPCRGPHWRQGGRVPVHPEGHRLCTHRGWRGARPDACLHKCVCAQARESSSACTTQDYTASITKQDKDALAVSLKTAYAADKLKFTGTFTQAGKVSSTQRVRKGCRQAHG